jgi:hypothetical protein
MRSLLDGGAAELATRARQRRGARVSPMFEQIQHRWNGLRVG